MSRRMLVMFAASLGFFFATATTFTSLGYVLYTMVAELGWSQTLAGMSFSLLGLACGLSSPLPPMMMRAVGTRMTMFVGALVLATGFFLASMVHGIGMFFLATTLMGIGFSIIAPSPAIYLLATWFPDNSARMIGFYFMAGALGGVVGPLIVNLIVSNSGSWRVHWFAMGGSAVVLSIVLLACIRDAVKVETTEQVRNAASHRPPVIEPAAWTVSQAVRTPSFLFLALAMMVVQTIVTTMHSVLVTHVASLGAGTSGAGALAMSLLALTGTFAKGVTGALTEKVDAKAVMVAGLALQSAAVALLCLTATPAWVYAFALVFGMGWGLSWLGAHVLLLRYFGAAIAGEMVAVATMSTTFAVLGPLSAGWAADTTGSFIPMFAVIAVMLALVAMTSAFFMRAPGAASSRQEPDEMMAGFALEPAE